MSTYQNLIDNIQFYIQPEISWNRWFYNACTENESLTPMGVYLHTMINGGTFIDIPCGLRNPPEREDASLLPLLKQLGITTYIAVDKSIKIITDRMEQYHHDEKKLSIDTFQSDLLEFVSEFERPSDTKHLTWYLSGLQMNPQFILNEEYQQQTAVPYLKALYTELERATVSGDCIIFNDAASLINGIDESIYTDIHPIISLSGYGFTHTKSCPHNKVQILEKE